MKYIGYIIAILVAISTNFCHFLFSFCKVFHCHLKKNVEDLLVFGLVKLTKKTFTIFKKLDI